MNDIFACISMIASLVYVLFGDYLRATYFLAFVILFEVRKVRKEE